MDIDFELLKSNGIFMDNTEEELQELTQMGTREKFTEDKKVFSEGDTNSDFFLLLKGEADIILQVPSEDSGVNIHIVPEGSVFGHFSFLDGYPRSATVRAKTDIEVLRVTHEGFDKFKVDNPVLALKLMETLTKSICQAIRGENAFLQAFLDFRSVSNF